MMAEIAASRRASGETAGVNHKASADGQTVTQTAPRSHPAPRNTSAMPPSIYTQRCHKIALMHPDEQMGAVAALAQDFNMNVAVVASAVIVESDTLRHSLDGYRPHGLPHEFKRWAPGTENAVRHHRKVNHWLVISECAPTMALPDFDDIDSLWLPAFNKPEDFKWPVHGRPVTCVLGDADLLRKEAIALELFKCGATEVTCRLVSDDGTTHVMPYHRGKK